MSRRTPILTVAAFAFGLFMPEARVGAQPSPRVVKIVGEQHKLLLRDDGSVAGWGAWRLGQLGPVGSLRAETQHVGRLVPIALPGKAIDVAAGEGTSFALLADGTVVGWGSGAGGQLGIAPEARPRLSTSTPSSEYRGLEQPTRIRSLTDAVAIAAQADAVFAVLRDGTVKAWGSGSLGNGRLPSEQGGPPTNAGAVLDPITVPGLSAVTAISAGGGAVLALTRDGRVFSWGSNFYGALGRPPRVELVLDAPGEVPGLTDVVQIVAGLGVATALKEDGTVWVWGSNWQQQFGFPAPTDQPRPNGGWVLTPQLVPGVTGVAEIALGLTGRHTLARLKDGTLRVWGGGGATEWPLKTNVRVPSPAPPDLK